MRGQGNPSLLETPVNKDFLKDFVRGRQNTGTVRKIYKEIVLDTSTRSATNNLRDYFILVQLRLYMTRKDKQDSRNTWMSYNYRSCEKSTNCRPSSLYQ